MAILKPKTMLTLKRDYAPPLVPLIHPEPKEIGKGESIKLELCYNLTDANSATYSMSVHFFKQGSPIEWIKFCKLLE